MMLKKTRLILFLIPLFSLPIISLVSCASISQYGTLVAIDFGTNNPFPGADIANPDNYGFDSLSGDFYKNSGNPKKWSKYNPSDNVESLSFFGYLEGIRLFVDTLVTKSHYDTSLSKIGNIYKGVESSTTPPSTDPVVQQNLLDEFILASANILNQGDDGDLKFGINKISIENMPSTSNIFNIVSIDKEATTPPTPTDLILQSKEKKILETVATTTGFNLSFEFTYYNASNSNAVDNKVNDIKQVNDYLKRDNAWNGKEATTLNWKISIPLQTIFKSVYSTTREIDSTAIDGSTKLQYDKKTDKFSSIEFYIYLPTNLVTSFPKPLPKFLGAFPEENPPKFVNRTSIFNDWLVTLSNSTTLDKLNDFSKALTLSQLAIIPKP